MNHQDKVNKFAKEEQEDLEVPKTSRNMLFDNPSFLKQKMTEEENYMEGVLENKLFTEQSVNFVKA